MPDNHWVAIEFNHLRQRKLLTSFTIYLGSTSGNKMHSIDRISCVRLGQTFTYDMARAFV